ncbi:MAG: V-type ATP synthase subunit E family protein [Anaerolineae bacterium]|jgi:vacuolar-type H+-ATPase subunit E/Vma4|nr:V-type ATP synthase subunit E family protein [Anaerolineae bacterium]
MDFSTSNIQDLSRTVLRSAEQEAQKVLSEAEEKANQIRKIAEQEREDAYHQVIAKALKEADFIRNKNRATVEAEVQMDWLVKREALINDVFDHSFAALHTIVDQENYQQVILGLVAEAIFQINDDTVILHLDEKADQLVDDDRLQEMAEQYHVTLQRGDVLKDRYGVIAQTVDGHRQFDNTLQTRLERMKGKLRMPVYQILMGEK